jgi:hypothetical protein
MCVACQPELSGCDRLARLRAQRATAGNLRLQSRAKVGGQGRNRTSDTVIFSHVLYQLSYLALRSGLPKDVQKPEYNMRLSRRLLQLALTRW